MVVRYFETKDGKRGFVQKEGIFNVRWVIYLKKFLGDEKIGEVDPSEDDLRRYLEEKFNKPIKIWGLVFKLGVSWLFSFNFIE